MAGELQVHLLNWDSSSESFCLKDSQKGKILFFQKVPLVCTKICFFTHVLPEKDFKESVFYQKKKKKKRF